MSDLTITLAGDAVAKKTGGEVLSANKKLTQMSMDVIDVTVTPTADTAHVVGDVMFVVTKIPNAVATKGGSAILQSVSAIGTSTAGDDLGAFDLVITSDETALTDAAGSVVLDPASALTNAIAVMDGTLGRVSISNMIDVGVCMIGNKANLGIVCKAEATSRDLYVWGIAQSTDGWAGSPSLVLRFGFVQD
jgi:hypothetical protein